MYANDSAEPKTIQRGLTLGTVVGINGGNFAYCSEAMRVLNGYLGCSVDSEKISAEKTKHSIAAEGPDWLEQEYQTRYQHDLPQGVVGPDLTSSTYRETHINEKLSISQQQQLRKLTARFAILFNDALGMARQSEEECLQVKVPAEL
jgi:hypothetical protein